MVSVVDNTDSDLWKLIRRDIPATAGKDLRAELADWLHLAARRVPQRPRSVNESIEIATLRSQHPALAEIARLLREGGDLEPWLSNTVRNRPADPRADLMFNDWQILHFHLSQVFVTDTQVGRTGPLMFAYLDHKRAILLDVQPHGSWAMRDLLRILRRTEPDIMDASKLRNALDLSFKPTDDEILSLRQEGVNPAFEIDGEFFMSPGGGVVGTRHALRLIRLADDVLSTAEKIRTGLEANAAPAGILAIIAQDLALPVDLAVRYEAGEIIFFDRNRDLQLWDPLYVR